MSDPFSYAVIGKAMAVHRELGPGLDEMLYHKLLSEQLSVAGIEHLFRPREQLIHRGAVADLFEADLIFPGKLVAELKCLRGGFDPEHYVQIICYQKFWRIATGLLLDFGKDGLLHRRVNYQLDSDLQFTSEGVLADAPHSGLANDLATAVCYSIGHVLAAYGLGYRDTTYRGLLAAEFQAQGLGCVAQPITPVLLNGRLLGETQCDCLAVAGGLGIQVLAIRKSVTAADIAILRTHLRLLGLPCGLILNFGKNRFDHRWVVGSGAKI
jgi:GxxExxY protein